MPTSVSFSPAQIDFGPVRPGTFGPDISAIPPGFSSSGGVVIQDIPADATVVARVEGDPAHFQLRDLCVVDWVWETVDPGELPPGHRGPPPRVRVREIVDQSTGSVPLSIRAGQSLLVRAQYAALSTDGRFEASLVIEGDGWEPVTVPLSLFLAEVDTRVAADDVQVVQGGFAMVPVAVHSLFGPATDVSYEMSATQLHTGLQLQSPPIHVEAGQNALATLTLQAAPDAPLGSNQVAIDQLAFGRRGFFVPVEILTPQPPRPQPPQSGPSCIFHDPPGTPALSPAAYGFQDGHPRKSQLTYFYNSGLLPLANGASPATPVPLASLDSVIQQAFGVWAAAAPTLRASRTFDTGADITFGTSNLNPGNAGGGLLGKTYNDDSAIDFDNGNAVWRAQVAAILPADPPNTASLLAVAVHEIGHALGLLHSTNPASVMRPLGNAEILAPEDVSAIRALYSWQPQQRIAGFGTESGPAICNCGGTLVLAWRGTGDDHNLYYSQSTDGQVWTDQRIVFDAASSHGPSLAWDAGRGIVWMVWKGVPGDQGLYYASWNISGDWGNVQNIAQTGSSHAPSVAMIGGTPWLVWKGVEGDPTIYSSTYADATGWSGQNGIGGVGTSDTPTIAADPVSGVPRLLWKGVEGDFALYTSTLRASSIGGLAFWQPQEQVSWLVLGNGAQGTATVGRPGSAMGPAAMSAGSLLSLVWRGEGDDQGLWYTRGAPDTAPGLAAIAEWSTQARVGDFASSSRPSLTSFKGNTWVAWKGIADDRAIYRTFV